MILEKKISLFDKLVKKLELQNYYNSSIICTPSGRKFIKMNIFGEVEVYDYYTEKLLRTVKIDFRNDDEFSLFFKITKGL